MRAALLLVLALSQLTSTREIFDLGRTHDEALWDAFNRGYQLTPADTIERAEVITEFRRAVLFVHEAADKGEFHITDQDLNKAMTPFSGLVTFVVQARLHPLHTYSTPPAYDVYVQTGGATGPVGAKPLKRQAVYPPGLGPGASMSAVLLEATFPRADIESASAPLLVVTDDQANVIWRARIDLARYR
jgi:hypothetical protein